MQNLEFLGRQGRGISALQVTPGHGKEVFSGLILAKKLPKSIK
jgi:hypothetical protein